MAGHIPKISIVVPYYNQGSFLQETLESISKQEYPNLEIIMMEGGSTDQSLSIAQVYDCQKKCWEDVSEGGRAAATNKGVQYCTGELFAWLEAGDQYSGEYTFEIGLAAIPWEDHMCRRKFSLEELCTHFTHICHVPDMGPLSAALLQETGVPYMTHFGIANLNGRTETYLGGRYPTVE
jgi:glycosyltransferase involved in cell wall biosynthesis